MRTNLSSCNTHLYKVTYHKVLKMRELITDELLRDVGGVYLSEIPARGQALDMVYRG